MEMTSIHVLADPLSAPKMYIICERLALVSKPAAAEC
jgi:hypothetical protein